MIRFNSKTIFEDGGVLYSKPTAYGIGDSMGRGSIGGGEPFSKKGVDTPTEDKPKPDDFIREEEFIVK
jgi:hypothetical protein